VLDMPGGQATRAGAALGSEIESRATTSPRSARTGCEVEYESRGGKGAARTQATYISCGPRGKYSAVYLVTSSFVLGRIAASEFDGASGKRGLTSQATRRAPIGQVSRGYWHILRLAKHPDDTLAAHEMQSTDYESIS